MRDLAFEAEDIIDTFMYYELRGQQWQPGCFGFIKRFVFIFDELISRHKVHVDVEGIKTKLKDLSQSRGVYGISNIGETIGTTGQSRSQNVIPILPQLSDDIDMVGFDDEKKKIVQELLDINNANRSVISIVGMGGLGKTTLAKSVYNDHEVKRRFDIFAWVIISQEYTIHEVLKRISSEVSATPLADTIQDLSVAISEKLKKGKYLIVLDDVWEEDAWTELLKVFPDVNNGSRVIITTRVTNVAMIANPTTRPHELRCLDEKESRELFLRKVFFPRQDIETCYPTCLDDYAHQLVQRCSGLPLALVVLGGLMSTKPTSGDAWRKVVESMKGQFVEGGERCLEILALSYNDLPYYLKSCFLYFGCFREDMKISAQTLIRMWSAEGFLPTENGKTTEEIGIDCIEKLAQRCLIQVTDRRYDDIVAYCQIHDILRDMCIKEAKENRYLEIYMNDPEDHVTMSNIARRLIISNDIETLNCSNSKFRVLFFGGYIYDSLTFQAMNRQLGAFKLLRVLYLFSLRMPEFPSEIKSLIHLRYLELHADNLKEVPSWIDHLSNLQTFIVVSGILEKISDSLWRIDSLRHVDVPMSLWLHPPNMGNIKLKNLQTLKSVKAGEWIDNVLPKLINLLKLKIYDVSNDHASALSSSRHKLGHLISLYIQGDVIPLDNVITTFSNQRCLKKLKLNGRLNCRELPRTDVFPHQLVKLTLINSNLEQDPMKTLERLHSLKYLQLYRSYIGREMICSKKGFPQLLTLDIEYFSNLEEWKIEEEAMPCLKYLNLSACLELKVVPEGLKYVPLDELVLHFMPEDWSKIQHVPNFSCH